MIVWRYFQTFLSHVKEDFSRKRIESDIDTININKTNKIKYFPSIWVDNLRVFLHLHTTFFQPGF